MLTLSARSVWAHRVKSLIVGSILASGTFLLVLGLSLLSSVQSSMARSITSSLAGHLQVYAADAQDELALFGQVGMSQPDVGEIQDFAAVDGPLSEVENVAAVVPMGLTSSTVFGTSEIDRVLEQLRAAGEAGDEYAQAALIPQVRRIARSLLDEQSTIEAAAGDREAFEREVAALRRADSEAFWSRDFAADREAALGFLESEISPMAGDAEMLFLRLLGTDVAQFTEHFDRFYVVDGEPIPPGKRGFLFSERVYETQNKNRVAAELDAIYEEVIEDGATIAGDPLLQERIRRMSRQHGRITHGLDPAAAERLFEFLHALLVGPTGDMVEGGLDALAQGFLAVDDDNLEARYRAFYEHIAPEIRLYEVPVGGVITLRSYTRSGYLRSINVRVYGTYDFEGLERSDIAGFTNIIDLVTFRDLYGQMSAEQQAELAEIKASAGLAEVSREDAEAALFGGGDEPLVEEGAQSGAFAAIEREGVAVGELGRLDTRTYTPEEMRDGLALNAAILLEDPARLDETRAAVEAVIAERGLNLQVVDWQTASGMVGQFLFVVGAVLVVALVIIFTVALLIINNSMVMATMDRFAEIGTMRAIGARRRLVVGLFLGETALIGLVAGAAGAAAGALVVGWLGRVGLPAVQDVLVLLFAGPRLYPTLAPSHLLLGVLLVFVVGVISTLYPASLAARVPPVVAMQRRE